MDKDEMKNRISLALKDPILQQGFEIICKENAELKRFIKDLFYENSNLCFHFSNTTCLFNTDYRNKAEELIGERL